MKITVNGTSREAESNQTLGGLLAELNLNPRTTLIELNGEVLDRAEFDATQLNDGDIVELVRFVGGG